MYARVVPSVLCMYVCVCVCVCARARARSVSLEHLLVSASFFLHLHSFDIARVMPVLNCIGVCVTPVHYK